MSSPYDQQVKDSDCVEGFGCPRIERNMNKFLLLVVAIAVVAYLCSTRTVKEYNIGVMQGGYLSHAFTRANNDILRMLQ